jgi:hypothetical protein
MEKADAINTGRRATEARRVAIWHGILGRIMVSSSVAMRIILHTLSHVAVANPARRHRENGINALLYGKPSYAAMQHIR